jgi:hypothetical protein
MANTVVPRLVMAAGGARIVTAQAARIDELVIDGTVDVTLTGDIALRSVQTGTNRALTGMRAFILGDTSFTLGRGLGNYRPDGKSSIAEERSQTARPSVSGQ